MTLLIFDVDATLVYSDKLDSKCFAQTYQQVYGLPFPTIDWHRYPHVTDDTIFKTVIQEHFQRIASQEEMEDFKQKFLEGVVKNRVERPNDFKRVPGAKVLIESLLQRKEYTIGIATGGWKAPAVMKLNFLNIPTEPLLISGADGKETRHQIIQEVIAQATALKRSFNRIVYVGDAQWDVTTTRDMQIPLVGVRLKGDLTTLQKEGVQHVVKDYQDIEQFMEYVGVAVPPLTKF